RQIRSKHLTMAATPHKRRRHSMSTVQNAESCIDRRGGLFTVGDNPVLKTNPNPSVRVASAVDGRPASLGRAANEAVHGQIGFIGLGRMGKSIAANLAADGHEVIAYVRRAEQVESLS